MLSYFLTSIEPEWGVTILQLFSTCPIVSQVNIIYFSTPYHFIINEYFNISLSTTPVFSNMLSSLRVNWIKFIIYFFPPMNFPRPAKHIHLLSFHNTPSCWRLQQIEHIATEDSPVSYCFYPLMFVYSLRRPAAQNTPI